MYVGGYTGVMKFGLHSNPKIKPTFVKSNWRNIHFILNEQKCKQKKK